MKNLLNHNDRESLIERIQNLSPESSRRWGSMSARQVVPHMTDPLRVALGDREAQPMPSLLGKWPFSVAAVWWMPWPKGAPTADEHIDGKKGTPPADFERDRQTLLLTVHRFVNYPEKEPLRPSPVFGPLSRKAWGRLMWRHIDHHLRQFGV